MVARLTLARLGLILMAAVVLLLLSAVPVLAVDGWTARSLAPAPGRQEVAGLDGDYCLYQETVGSGPAQIYLADFVTGVTTRITNTPYDCRNAHLDGGLVVYEGYVASDNPEIFVYEIASGQTTRLTTNNYPDRNPEIGGGGVTWVGSLGPVHDGSDQEIFFYDVASRMTTRVTNNHSIDMDARPSGSHVVWRELVGTEMQVFAYDALSGSTEQLSQGSTSNRNALVSGGLVAWIGNSPEMTDCFLIPKVYLYNLATSELKTLPAQLPPGVVQMTIDTLALHDGLLAWSWRAVESHISVYDPATDRTTDFGGDNLYPITDVAVSRGLLAWQQSDWHDDEIMVGDLATGITSQLTTNGNNDWHPMTAEGRVVWQDYTEGRAQLKVASTSERPSSPFVDVSGTTRSRSAVVELAGAGVFSGYPAAGGAEFRPNAPILRAQLAKILVEAFDLPVSEGMTCPFTDLSSNDPSTLYPNDYVAAAYQAGLIRGTTARTFSPWQTVSRGQSISLVVRYVLKQYPDSLPFPPEGEFALSDEYPSVHNDNIRVAFYNGLLGGVETGDGGWNPWFDIKRVQVAQILVNARTHIVATPQPSENFYAQGPSIKSAADLNAYLDQQKTLLTRLATSEPTERALVHVSFTHPISAVELARLEAAYGLDTSTRSAIFEHAGIGGGPMELSAGDWVRYMQAQRLFAFNSPPGTIDDGSPGELVGFTDIDARAPLQALARLQEEEAALLVDLWKFYEQMRDGRRQGLEVNAGSYPYVYYAYQKYVLGQ